MGILSIINSTIVPEIGNISEPLSINKMVLEQMNQSGLYLEEQNDKNS